jgi:hypothetical protein
MIITMRIPRDELNKHIRTEAHFIWCRRKANNDAGADNAEENWAKATMRIMLRYGVE